MKKEAHIFAKDIDPAALKQFDSAMAQKFVVKGALMPDAHKGYSLPIGGVVAVKDMVLPSWVGYDIGCGMCAFKTEFNPDEIKANISDIFRDMYLRVPVGFRHNKKNSAWDSKNIERSFALQRRFDKDGLKQLCSLGGGNHFIEIGADEDDDVWIIVHSGSRGIGHDIAGHYMKKAGGGKAREGHYGFKTSSPEGKSYIKDMNFCLAFALENRKQILKRTLNILYDEVLNKQPESIDLTDIINKTHNHAEFRQGLWIHRKGATQAREGELGVIPGNMRDGSFIVEGLGNRRSLWSSSHGAGRILGRRKAKEKLSLEEFKQTMRGVKAKVVKATLDESPFAYKDIFEILDKQKSMVKILRHIKPIINIKA